VVLLHSSKRELIVDAFRAGARGIFSRQGSIEMLMKAVRRVHELQPEHYQARSDLVQLLIAAHDFQQAKEQTDWLLRKRPDDPQVHVAHAGLLAGKDDIPGAVEEMQKAIAMAPNRSSLYLSLALLQSKNNQSEAAALNFKKAIELDPKSPDVSFLAPSISPVDISLMPSSSSAMRSQPIQRSPNSAAHCRADATVRRQLARLQS
jgi:tetratricopeptide (TPR) repeat protein